MAYLPLQYANISGGSTLTQVIANILQEFGQRSPVQDCALTFNHRDSQCLLFLTGGIHPMI
jgi:hypothetical protein